MGESDVDPKNVSGKRVLLVLLVIAVVMQVLLTLFILDVRRRKPSVIGPAATQPAATQPATTGPANIPIGLR